MKRIYLSKLRQIIKEEVQRDLSEGFLDFFWNRRKEPPLNAKNNPPQEQQQAQDSEKENLYNKMYKIMSALTTIYSRGRRQKEITGSSPFKSLLNSGVFKVKNQWELYKIIADASGSPDENDPYYKFGQLNVVKSRDVQAPRAEVNKGATERGKNILGHAGHLMKSVDDLDRRLSTEGLRRIIRQILKDS